jgi:predicted Zn-dependent protease
LKIKLKGRHFDTTEVIEAESQVMLNTLSEHNFQDAFKKWQKIGNGAYMQKETTSRVMEASRTKVSF